MGRLFLTGRVGTGKSTLLFENIKPLKATIAGYYVQRLNENGNTWGFKMLAFKNGVEAVLNRDLPYDPCHPDLIVWRQANGVWQGRMQTFETTGAEILEQIVRHPPRLVLLDEIGRYEEGAARFRSALERVLDFPVTTVGVLKKHDSPFLNVIAARPEVEVVDLDEMPRQKAETLVRDFLRQEGLFGDRVE